MNYVNYASKCNMYIHELKLLCTEDDVKFLASVLRKISSDTYKHWFEANSFLIDEFLVSSNQQRHQRKYKKLNKEDYLLLILACIQKAEAARFFLKACADAFLEKAHPCKLMCLAASQACFQVFEGNPIPHLYWAFYNICDSPFEDS